MASVRFTEVQARPQEFLDVTSVTRDEFQQLVPPFEMAFQAPMAAWRLAGTPRTARRFAVSQHCPLATPEDYAGLWKDLRAASRPGPLVWPGAEQNHSVDARPLARSAGGVACPR